MIDELLALSPSTLLTLWCLLSGVFVAGAAVGGYGLVRAEHPNADRRARLMREAEDEALAIEQFKVERLGAHVQHLTDLRTCAETDNDRLREALACELTAPVIVIHSHPRLIS